MPQSVRLANARFSRATRAEISHVQRARKHVPQQPKQVLGQLLIEEQSLDSGRRNTVRPAFAFRGVGETGPNVFRLQLWEFLEELSLIFPSGQVPEDVAHGNPSPANTRLPKPDRRIDADAIEKTHMKQCRAQSANPPKPSCIGGYSTAWPVCYGADECECTTGERAHLLDAMQQHAGNAVQLHRTELS